MSSVAWTQITEDQEVWRLVERRLEEMTFPLGLCGVLHGILEYRYGVFRALEHMAYYQAQLAPFCPPSHRDGTGAPQWGRYWWPLGDRDVRRQIVATLRTELLQRQVEASHFLPCL